MLTRQGKRGFGFVEDWNSQLSFCAKASCPGTMESQVENEGGD